MKDPAARRAAYEAAGVGERPAFFLSQVHGTEIVAVAKPEPPDQAPKADGFLTALPGIILNVFVADCLPIFVWERTGKAVGVFHAGWRGVAKGMPREAVASFKRHFGIPASDLLVDVGPHIRECCFRVGPETAKEFPAESVLSKDGGLYVDLALETRRQLLEAGVASVKTRPVLRQCTSCESDRFFSFRRDKTDARMMAFISLDP
jgi:polyphenol oxidase